MAVQERSIEPAVLSSEQREFFDTNGYLVVEDALPPNVVGELDAAIEELYEREDAAGRLEAGGKLNMRNCLVQHDTFLQLVDWPATVPLAWQILNWNIQMITSQLIVLAPQPEPPPERRQKVGLHRDGGTSFTEMTEPHPRILLKIAYAISDQSDPASGATVLAPGSNRLTGPPPVDPETGAVRGAIPMAVRPGTAFVFEQRTWHGIGQNWSGFPRKTLFYGYAYRWVKPMDYITMPEDLLERCNPVQKQLLGVVSDPLSYYLPKDEDVPLKALVEQNG